MGNGFSFPYTVDHLRMTSDPRNLTTNCLLLTRSLPDNTGSINKHFGCHMCYKLYSHSETSWRKENVTKRIIRKRKYIYKTLFTPRNLCVSGPAQFKPCCLRTHCIFLEVSLLQRVTFGLAHVRSDLLVTVGTRGTPRGRKVTVASWQFLNVVRKHGCSHNTK